MTPAERSGVALSFARVLYVNRQATDETVAAGERVARAVGLRATILARWGGSSFRGTAATRRLSG